MNYRAPWWLPGGHLQTIWAPQLRGALARQLPSYQRERWTTPDDDFIDVDWLPRRTEPIQPRPLLVLLHGLEGASSSHYALAFARFALEMQWDFVVPHFRGCGGTLNRAPRAYHSGDHAEVGWMLRRLRQQHGGPLLVVGVSLGGNALLRWAEEAGESADGYADAIAALCAPLDLTAAGQALCRGWNRHVYGRMFLRTMKPRALAKWNQFPGLFDRKALLRAADLYAFDDIFTAPLHGFGNARSYWEQASALPHLHRIRIPTLLLNPVNDPFVPFDSLRLDEPRNPCLTVWHPASGGHLGLVDGAGPPGDMRWLPRAVGCWLKDQMHTTG